MYQIVHGSAGILIGSQTGNPWLAFIFGFISHFILDAIPHDALEIKRWQDKGGYMKKITFEAMLDLFLLLVLIIFLMKSNLLDLNYSILAGVAGAILPDYVWGFGELFKIRSKWLEWYKKMHNGDHALLKKSFFIPIKYALPIQVLLVVVFIWLTLVL